ncbi:MAG: cobalamin biosynthesis protein CobQ, partial [Candidatus Levybacteria bacterium]|nr:cobalamin biosynthesis protein CobQ [Candidatus Levybacteria bacterium]
MKNNKINYTLDAKRYSLVIGWLYPELMNIYGDRGNIICLVKRCEWRGITTDVKYLDPGFSDNDLKSCDFLLMGGAQDRQQTIVNEDLKKHHKTLAEMIDNGVPGLYVCGGFQFLGNYYKEADGTMIDGLGIFDLYTENPGPTAPRLIGNIAVEIQDSGFKIQENEKNHKSSIINHKSIIVGFENHGGRTILGPNIEPFGKVLKGHGNNKDGTEGAKYKNSFGTYMHGPILPKNPHFADHLLRLALEKKYGSIELKELDD